MLLIIVELVRSYCCGKYSEVRRRDGGGVFIFAGDGGERVFRVDVG